jgi:hypothetical protein
MCSREECPPAPRSAPERPERVEVVGDDDEEGERCAKWLTVKQSEMALTGHNEWTSPSRSPNSNRDR